jgi:rRNA processing protein Gar1
LKSQAIALLTVPLHLEKVRNIGLIKEVSGRTHEAYFVTVQNLDITIIYVKKTITARGREGP